MWFITDKQFFNKIKETINIKKSIREVIEEMTKEELKKIPSSTKKKMPTLKGSGEYDEYYDVLKEYDKEGTIAQFIKDKNTKFSEEIKADVKQTLDGTVEKIDTVILSARKSIEEGVNTMNRHADYITELERQLKERIGGK
jgi:hypothetical protein